MKMISPIEQEVNQIRLTIYEKIKDMTPSQVTEYYRKSGEKTAKKYGFKIITSAKESILKTYDPQGSLVHSKDK